MLERKQIHRLFESIARERANEISIIYNDREVTYKELNEMSNQLSNYIANKYGVSTGDYVGIYMDRSIDAIVSILAILKLGAVYVPLDPNYPSSWLGNALNKVNTSLIISKNTDESIINGKIDKVLNITKEIEEIMNESKINLDIEHSNNESYILFTSGSTGNPKGVLGSAVGIVNRINFMFKTYPLQKDEVFCLRTSLNFVDSVWDIFQPLLSGNKLLIIPECILYNHEQFIMELERWNVTRLSISPAHIRSLIKYEKDIEKRLRNIKILDVTGDQLSSDLALLLQKKFKNSRVLNRYGCTEVPSTMIFDMKEYNEKLHGDLVPLGKPIQGTDAFILDKKNRLIGYGDCGELCISGDQVAIKYFGEESLTNEKFINIKLNGVCQRVYKTGDIAKYSEDGHIISIGREDNQVKIRGNRVEIDLVEARLSAHYKINECMVAAVGKSENQKLKAYYESTSKHIDINELRSWMKIKLPSYMIPSIFCKVNKLPLLPNGKIDRKNISNIEENFNINKYKAPNNKLERTLCKCFEKVCNINQVGINDNFFDLGMDSLAAMEIVANLQKILGIVISMKELLRNPTVRDLSNVIENNKKNVYSSLDKIKENKDQREFPMSYTQRLLWRLDQKLKENQFIYNDCWAVQLDGTLNKEALQGALNDLVKYNSIFRTYYDIKNNEEIQIVSDDNNIYIEIIDISGLHIENHEAVIKTHIENDREKCFDLTAGPLLRAKIIKINTLKHILIISTHHITNDGWSGKIINKEISEFYNNRLEDKHNNIKSKSITYADFSKNQYELINAGEWNTQLDYWKQKLKGIKFRPDNLLDNNLDNQDITSFESDYEEIYIPKDVVERIKVIAKKENITIFMLLLAGLHTAFYRKTKCNDISIGSAIASRNNEQIQNIIGFFPNMLVFRQEIQDCMTYKELLSYIKDTCIEAYENQDIPIIKISEEIGTNSDKLHPLVSITFNIPSANERLGEGLVMNGIDGKLLDIKEIKSYTKFDISVSAIEIDNEIKVKFMYNKSLFQIETIKKLIKSYKLIISEISEDLNYTVNKLEILSNI